MLICSEALKVVNTIVELLKTSCTDSRPFLKVSGDQDDEEEGAGLAGIGEEWLNTYKTVLFAWKTLCNHAGFS